MFDLSSDPREQNDLAAKHPGIVKQLGAKHTAWSKTLAPLGEVPKIRGGGPSIPNGYGWAIASAEGKGDTK